MKTCKKGLHQYDASIKGCPECQKVSKRAWELEQRKNPAYIKALSEKRKRNSKPELERKRSTEWKQNNLDRVRGNELRRKYWPNASWEEALNNYKSMLETQGNCCKICKVDRSQFKKNFCVDHDHQTGQVRGLLCIFCNRNIVGSIDQRLKAKKVTISKAELLSNIENYFKE